MSGERCRDSAMPPEDRDNEERFSLADRFFIDDGELNDIDPRVAFCLGVEFATFRQRLLASPGGFVETVHEKNIERIEQLCLNHGRKPTANKKEPGWHVIAVGPVP